MKTFPNPTLEKQCVVGHQDNELIQQVTVKEHPHLSVPYVSIHPCRHADVMKKIGNNMLRLGREPRVDNYLMIFLKFLSAVIPSIEYDNTYELEIPLM